MAEDRTNLLVNLEVHIRQILLLCDNLKLENNKLRSELIIKEDDIAKLKKDISLLNQKYDNLKMARTITAASVDVDNAKSKLSELVREVDKCIGLLKK